MIERQAEPLLPPRHVDRPDEGARHPTGHRMVEIAAPPSLDGPPTSSRHEEVKPSPLARDGGLDRLHVGSGGRDLLGMARADLGGIEARARPSGPTYRSASLARTHLDLQRTVANGEDAASIGVKIVTLHRELLEVLASAAGLSGETLDALADLDEDEAMSDLALQRDQRGGRSRHRRIDERADARHREPVGLTGASDAGQSIDDLLRGAHAGEAHHPERWAVPVDRHDAARWRWVSDQHVEEVDRRTDGVLQLCGRLFSAPVPSG